ncbi:MAG: hypothetical protein BAJATHORv1_30314 [Candidatus Thorarchaeota archaeon]|nr:MAG: hypothetical protein BAJATHORv1_30314 [Candidatus Thorarchaeota archaeon]
MRILAVADVHSPRYLEEFASELTKYNAPDLFLMAGDMVNRGKADEMINVLDVIGEQIGSNFPIVGCFGNEEYSEIRDELVEIIGTRMIILDEQSLIFKIRGLKVGIVGTQGSLDRPTSWQRDNIPSIKRIFRRRVGRARNLLKRLEYQGADRRILLMHYSPCLETCEGEDRRAFSWLGSKRFYKILEEEQPDLVIHGHVHNATVHEAYIRDTRVRNVALPAVGTITELDIWT